MRAFRRLVVAALVLGTPVVHDAAAGSDYPDRPIRILVGFPPGTAADVSARLLAPKLGALLGQSVVIENRPGASSTIAADVVVHAAPDGYTLFMATVSNTVNVTLLPDQPFKFAADLAPVALVSTMPNILVLNPAVPATSVAELIALAKAHPGALSYGSAGVGTILHLTGELFNARAGVKLMHVPYKGSSEAMSDLLGGRISAMFAPVSTALPEIRAGKVRALATTGAQRSAVAPQLPTMIELGFPGFETGVWCGLMAPAGTPRDVIARLARAVDRAVSAPEVEALYAAQGIDMLHGGPDALAHQITAETRKWARVIHGLDAKGS